MRAKCDCGQQEQSGGGRYHETFALASPVEVSERSAALAVTNAPAAIFFQVYVVVLQLSLQFR